MEIETAMLTPPDYQTGKTTNKNKHSVHSLN